MSLDVQILSSTLLNLVQGTIQQMLDTTCVPPLGAIFFDHADVIGVSMSVDQQAGVANFDAPVNVFIVDMPALLANANGTPPGALAPRGKGSIQLQLAVQGTVLSLTCTSVTPPDPSLSGVANQLKSAIPPASVDLAPVFSQLGLPSPTSSLISQVNSSLVIRFNPSGQLLDHLQGTQDWCMFLDAATMKNIVVNKLSGPLSQLTKNGVTGATITVDWVPSGLVPHVNVKVTGKAQVPDPFTASVDFGLGIDFALQSVLPKNKSLAPKDLEEIADWNLSVDLGDFVPKFIADFVANLIASFFDPTKFGGTVIGSRQFSLSQSLPLLQLGPATFFYASVIGLADGMVLGGPITGIPTANINIVSYEVNKFPSEFVMVTDCLSGGEVGPATLTSVYVTASAGFSDTGKLCSVAVISPPQSSIEVSPYLGVSPAPGTITDTISISERLSGLLSLAVDNIGQPVQLLVNTARGVRVVDFGLPPVPSVDGNGNVTNFKLLIINDCPSAVDPWFQFFQSYNPKWSIDPYEFWIDNMEQVAVFGSSLVEVNGLQQGELITLNQPRDGGMAVFSAGQTGQVVVPIVLAVRSFDAPAILSRVNRSALRGVVQTTMLFERVAVIETPGALTHQLSAEGDRAVITSSFVDRTESIRIDSLGIPQHLGTQRLEHGGPANNSRAQASARENGGNPRCDIPGVVRVRTVPGFEQDPISVAELDDGTYLVLAREADGSVRVGGSVPRWPDKPPVSGRWAISSSKGDRVAVFTVRRVTPPAHRCCCRK